MDENRYIKFKLISTSKQKHNKPSIFIKALSFLISFFIPKGNPDFDNFIGDVDEWLLEIDATTNLPIREIGKDLTDKTLMIMPWRENYGYWTDNNATLDYFRNHFHATDITQFEFDEAWNSFANSTI